MKLVVLAALVLAACSGCGDKYPVAELQDPSTCKDCHPKHFQQWSGSMHAFASDDPVFVAMNKRGSREAQVGTFCVQCHAPMAVVLHPEKTDYSDFDPAALPPEEKGITCYFCHNVDRVKDDHNNGLVLALDQTMRGGVRNPDPVDTPAHNSAYDGNLMAGNNTKNQSTMCGSCHDVVTPAGVQIERSSAEFKSSVFGDVTVGPSCSLCHMKPSKDPIADAPGLNVQARDKGFHNHMLPAIDEATLPGFPETDAQKAGIQDILDPAIAIKSATPPGGSQPAGGICLNNPMQGFVSVRVDSFNVGHFFPSGAAQDRRVWIELIAYAADGTVLFSSGAATADQDPEDLHDPYVDCTDPAPFKCSGFWDRIFKEDGTPAHFFWEARTDTHAVGIRPPVTLVSTDPAFDHSTSVYYNVTPAITAQIDHMTARVRIRPFAYAALRELVTSGDLDPMYAQSLTELEGASSVKTWTKATAGTGPAINTGCNPD